MSEDLHSLLAPYVLDALDADERARFESHLDTCATCQEELYGFTETATALGASDTTTPPPALRERLLEAITTTPQERPRVVALRPRSRIRRVLPSVVAAAAIVIAAAGVTGYVLEHDRLGEYQAEQTRYEQVMTASDAERSVADLDDGGQLTMILSARADAAVLLASGLPDPGESVYQLWSMHDGHATSRGVFGSHDMLLLEDVSAADEIAVTLEPAGGSDQPTTTPIASMTV